MILTSYEKNKLLEAGYSIKQNTDNITFISLNGYQWEILSPWKLRLILEDNARHS